MFIFAVALNPQETQKEQKTNLKYHENAEMVGRKCRE
jgi:hypothetical protein